MSTLTVEKLLADVKRIREELGPPPPAVRTVPDLIQVPKTLAERLRHPLSSPVKLVDNSVAPPPGQAYELRIPRFLGVEQAETVLVIRESDAALLGFGRHILGMWT